MPARMPPSNVAAARRLASWARHAMRPAFLGLGGALCLAALPSPRAAAQEGTSLAPAASRTGALSKPATALAPKARPAARRNNDLGNRDANANVTALEAQGRYVPDAPPSGFPLTIVLEPIVLAPTPSNLRARIEALRDKPAVAEAIVLRFNTLEPGPIIEQLARSSIAERLHTREGNKLRADFRRHVLARVVDMRLTLDPRDLQWIDLPKLSSTLSQASVKPRLTAGEWALARANPESSARLADHFGDKAREAFAAIDAFRSANPGEALVPLEIILPTHMREILGRYSPLRGRNCFATALGFADRNVEAMRNINLMREEGHHAALINNDEFVQALFLGYRELDEQEILEGLRFGDVVAFVDRSEGDFYGSYKHAIVHTAGDVYLHKPSKSASTPIEFIRWKDVARVWASLTRELDYKVYRRLPVGSLKGRNSQIAIEKIQWSQ